MNDYGRSGPTTGEWSRYGTVESLDAIVEEMTLKKDRSFTFAIDNMDKDETARQLDASTALARQLRQVVIPEIDAYVYGVMTANAGTKPEAIALTKENIYEQILTASKTLDDALVPEEGRVLVVTPETYRLMKLNEEIIMNTDIGAEERKKGVLSILDGAMVIKVPASRLPAEFGFMLAHPSATVAPAKLADYRTHDNPPGINGTLTEGRFVYDAFVLENRAVGIYYQAITV